MNCIWWMWLLLQLSWDFFDFSFFSFLMYFLVVEFVLAFYWTVGRVYQHKVVDVALFAMELGLFTLLFKFITAVTTFLCNPCMLILHRNILN